MWTEVMSEYGGLYSHRCTAQRGIGDSFRIEVGFMRWYYLAQLFVWYKKWVYLWL